VRVKKPPHLGGFVTLSRIVKSFGRDVKSFKIFLQDVKSFGKPENRPEDPQGGFVTLSRIVKSFGQSFKIFLQEILEIF
jgi:hypothetical protein